ncbi:hypothetical protein [Pedobacter sp. GR22-6]|uniref:hypothetical protein n=1 Tax=Pedobacter sp. GR22-6 TaxID=3127957 RepID=UPI00307EA0B3
MTALLLIGMFVSLFAVQAFHSHYDETSSNAGFEKEIVPVSEHCEICVFLAQLQHKDYLMPNLEPMLIPSLPAPEHLSGVFTGNYKFTLQGFTNKGPPSFIS